MLFFLKPLVSNYSYTAILAITVHIVVTILTILIFDNKNRSIMIFAFLIRILLLFFDIFGRDIFVLPHSGADTEAFYNRALEVSQNFKFTTDSTLGLYPQITGLIFKLVGPMRIFVQYLNVLLGISTIYVLNLILDILDIKQSIKKIGIFIVSFMPISIIMSSIFLREIFPTFFVSLSLLYFVKWIRNATKGNMIISLMMVAIASAFHSGVAGIAIGYGFAYLFYDTKSKQFIFSRQTIVYGIMLSMITAFAFINFADVIFTKFQGIDSSSELFDKASGSGVANSVYLKGLEVNNFFELLFFSPIKAIYFYLSPLPWDWRGLTDVITFFLDSIFYLGTLIIILRYKNKILYDRKNMVPLFLLMLIASGVIFGLGVDNAGTAMRHRQKLLPIFLSILLLMLDSKTNNNKILQKNNFMLVGRKKSFKLKEDKMHNYNQREINVILSDLLLVLKRNVFKIISSGIVGITIASFFTFVVMKPQYSSTVDLVISEPSSQEVNQTTIQTNFSLLNTYESIIKKPNVLRKAIKDTGIDITVEELTEATTVNTDENSLILSIKVLTISPYESAELANSIGEKFVTEVKNTLKVNNVFIWNLAEPNIKPVSPNIVFNLLMGGLIGFALSIIYFTVNYIYDPTIRSEKFIESFGLLPLGTIPKMSDKLYNETLLSDCALSEVGQKIRRIK